MTGQTFCSLHLTRTSQILHYLLSELVTAQVFLLAQGVTHDGHDHPMASHDTLLRLSKTSSKPVSSSENPLVLFIALHNEEMLFSSDQTAHSAASAL